MFDYVINLIINLGERVVRLEEEVEVMEKLLAERDRVMHAIPACKIHGDQCVPHALEWIAKRKRTCKARTEQVQLDLNFDVEVAYKVGLRIRKESDGETICM